MMTPSELFNMSQSQYPNGGAVLSPAACGFITPEIKSRIEKYEEEMKDPTMSDTLRRMCAHQLEGLKEIYRILEEGFQNRSK